MPTPSQGRSAAATTQSRPSSKPKVDKPTKTQLTKQLAIGVHMAQSGLNFIKPIDEEDLLTDQEVGMLSRGIAAELLHYEKLLEWYLRLQSVGGPHAEFFGACVAIAAPRLARRNLLPEEIAIGITIAGMTLSDAANVTISMGSGRTPNPDGKDRVREVEHASAPTDLPEPLAISPDQARQSDLPKPSDSDGSSLTRDAKLALESLGNRGDRSGRQ